MRHLPPTRTRKLLPARLKRLLPALLPAALLLSSSALPTSPTLPSPAPARVNATSLQASQANTRPAARPAPTPAAASQTHVQFFDLNAVARSSARKDAEGNPLPPWTKVELAALAFKTKPAAGASVTVVPLGVKLPPLDLKITKVAREMNQCTAENFWQADLEPITRRDFRDAAPVTGRRPEYPFEVLVIYPAVKTYKLLEAPTLNARTLPRGITPKTVRAALDLDGDAQPELLYVHHCCDAPSKPLAQCDYECSKTYQKTRGVWKLTATHEPC